MTECSWKMEKDLISFLDNCFFLVASGREFDPRDSRPSPLDLLKMGPSSKLSYLVIAVMPRSS